MVEDLTPFLSRERLAGVVNLWVREGREFVARFGGASMEPTIDGATEVTVRCGAPLATGDIVCYLGREHVTLHRLIGRHAGWLLTRGDASSLLDPPVSESAVVGRVVALRRGGRVLPLTAPPESAATRLAFALTLAALRRGDGPGIGLIRLLWTLRRVCLLAPRSALRRIRGRAGAPRDGEPDPEEPQGQ